jgi:hypothetical protein
MALTVAAIRDPLRPFDGSEAWASKMRRQEGELQARFGQRMLVVATKTRSEQGNVGTTTQVLGKVHSAMMNPLL